MKAETNVDKLRKAGVLPAGVRLRAKQKSAINKLDPEDVEVVLACHAAVGTIDVPGDPPYRLFIF
jgi:hypothetical protein